MIEILDGAMGSEFIKRGISLPKYIWSSKMNLEAQERALQTFIKQALIRIPKVIEEDKDFVQNEIFSAPTENKESDEPRNRGLGPRLAKLILENAFGQNELLKPIYNDIRKVVEVEFNNAYGHCSISCSKFNIV